jgi:hypothetical protein
LPSKIPFVSDDITIPARSDQTGSRFERAWDLARANPFAHRDFHRMQGASPARQRETFDRMPQAVG